MAKSNPLSFESLTREINKGRAEYRENKAELNQARVDLKQTQQELREVSRNQSEEKAAELAQLHEQNQQRVNDIHALVDSTASRVGAYISTLISVVDPRQAVENLHDSTPVLLLPVRVETRFMTVKHVVRVEPAKSTSSPKDGPFTAKETQVLGQSLPVIEDKQELWIRIFPDDIHVHTHEAALTQEEIDAAQAFWTGVWPFLAIESANGYVEEEIGYWRVLCSGRSTERAAWIAQVAAPTNLGSGGGAPVFPASYSVKSGSWTEAPHSKVMPDSFIVRLYNGNTWREVLGKAIPDPLPISVDPNEDENAYDFANGDLKLPANLRWLEDFKEAEKVGMGIRVSLSNAEFTGGFDKIFVLGIKSSSDRDEAQALLEELIENHHFTTGGFALVPQGTPTNNTGDASAGYTAYDDDATGSYLTELKAPLFTEETDDRKKADGQHLAEALGIRFEVVNHLRNSGAHDIKEAMCMNRALWPTTLGYYLSQMMYPVFDKATIKTTRNHFNQFVLGRGRVPAVRVDNQPYGIQPATAFSRWVYSGNNARVTYLTGLQTEILNKMAVTWKLLVAQVKHAGDNSLLPPEKFLDMITLHPASIEFYQRFSGGKWFLWNLFSYSQRVAQVTMGSGLSPAITYLHTLGDIAARMGALGFSPAGIPRIFEFTFLKEEKYLRGPVIDGLPLSETRSLQQIAATGKNYIEWLIASNYTQVRNEDFTNIGAPANTTPPTALLYLMLRQSCLLEIVRTAVSVLIADDFLTPEAEVDFELGNIGNATVSLEQQALVRQAVEMELTRANETQLRNQLNQEFSGSRLAPNELETQRGNRLNQLRAESSGGLTTRIENEYQRRIAEIQVTPAKADLLTETYEGLTSGQTLETYITTLEANFNEEIAEMLELKASLECLQHLPTARLERAFVETLDVCNYRLDSWMYSLVTERLNQQRLGQQNRSMGIYLGSFGWIENLVPSGRPGIAVEEVLVSTNSTTTTVLVASDNQLDIRLGATTQSGTTTKTSTTKTTTSKTTSTTQLAPGQELVTFSTAVKVDSKVILQAPLSPAMSFIGDVPRFIYLGRGGSSTLVYDGVQNKFVAAPAVDPNNQGYIHAPSVNQAIAAGVLRAGYESHATIGSSPAPGPMAVNLSSARVRRALFYIEGIRNGQELAALLGYQFERNLHDKYTGFDEWIYDLRLLYPLVMNRVNAPSGATQVREGEAYNVVDGLKLLDAWRLSMGGGPNWYGTLTIPAADITKMETEIMGLEEALDAIADLLLAESVFQASQGNAVRAGSTLEALARGSGLQELEILRTPRTSDTLTHKVGIQFDLSPGGDTAWSGSASPRSAAEPHLNRWIASLLPPPDKICVKVSYIPNSPPNSTALVQEISIDKLGLQAIDLYSLLTETTEPGLFSDLSARLGFVLRTELNSDDIHAVEVLYMEHTGFDADEISLFEIMQLMQSIKEMLLKARAVSAEDLLLNSEAESLKEGAPTLAPFAGWQPDLLFNRLNPQTTAMQLLIGNIGDIITDYDNNPATLTLTVLTYLRGYLLSAGLYNIPNSTPPTALVDDATSKADIIALASRVNAALTKKKDEGSARLAEYGAIAMPVAPNDTAANIASALAARVAKLEEAAKALFGRSFKVFPEYRQIDPLEFERARVNPDYLDTLVVGDFALEEWMQGISRVRKPLAALLRVDQLTEAIKGTSYLNLEITQLPLHSLPGGPYDEKWLGTRFNINYEVPGDNLSVLFQYPSGFVDADDQAGMLIDEWVEEIPHERATTGIATHYNNPDTEAPNSMLLCVTPEETGQWKWNVLMDTLNETLEWAKVRAVDPDLINPRTAGSISTPYAHLLPALIASISGNGSSPTLDFGRNNARTPVRFAGPILDDEVANSIDFTA